MTQRYLAVTLAVGSRDPRLRDSVAAAAGPTAKVLRVEGGVSILLDIAVDTDARGEAERIRAAVADALGDSTVTAGVAGPKSGATGAHFALVQAEHALAVGRAFYGDGRTTHFDELGAYCFVLNQPADEVRAFAERVLGVLITDDTHEELVDTLEAYLRLKGNLNAVARRLFLHRNTVRYRLRRIATMLAVDLEDPDARLAMQLAILGSRVVFQRPTRRMAS